jgi:hypothetical protein
MTSDIEKWRRWDTHTDTQTRRQQGDLISLLVFFSNEGKRLKMMRTMMSVCGGFGWTSRADLTEEQLEQTTSHRNKGADLYSGGA